MPTAAVLLTAFRLPIRRRAAVAMNSRSTPPLKTAFMTSTLKTCPVRCAMLWKARVASIATLALTKKEHTFLIDCRTLAEYQFVGHPVGAYNIPLRFLSNKVGEKGYVEVANPDFVQALIDRFNPESDTLIILCRSGNRSCTACNAAIRAGFKEEKVFNMMGGFEGGKNKNKDSVFYN